MPQQFKEEGDSVKTLFVITLGIAMILCLIIGCDRSIEPSVDSDQTLSVNQDIAELEMAARQFAPVVTPDPLETVDFDGQELTFWPYTGNDFTGEGHDPINLGQARRALCHSRTSFD